MLDIIFSVILIAGVIIAALCGVYEIRNQTEEDRKRIMREWL